MPANRILTLAVTGAMLVAAVLPAPAQVVRHRPVETGIVGATVGVFNPVGAFGNYVSLGGQLGVNLLYRFGPARAAALRVDGAVLIYDWDEFDTYAYAPRAGAIPIEVSTEYLIYTFGAGPQIMVPAGPVRPYLYGTVGFSYFVTRTGVSYDDWDDDYDDAIAADLVHLGDLTLALAGGGGIYIQASRGPRPVFIDLAVSWTRNGQAEYLTPERVIDHEDGSVSIFPIHSDANFVTFRLGVAFTL